MVFQRIARIGMHEDVERAVIQRELFEHRREVFAAESELKQPHRMRADRPLMKPPQRERALLQGFGEARFDDLPQLPRGIAGRYIEIDMRMPTGQLEMAAAFVGSIVSSVRGNVMPVIEGAGILAKRSWSGSACIRASMTLPGRRACAASCVSRCAMPA